MSQNQKRWHLNSSLPATHSVPGTDKDRTGPLPPSSVSLGRTPLPLALVGGFSFLPKRHMALLKGRSCGVGVGKELAIKQPSEQNRMPQWGPPGGRNSPGKLLTLPALRGVPGGWRGAMGPLPATGSHEICLNLDRSPTTDLSLLTKNE